MREGDSFTVTKLDRHARSVFDLRAIVARLEVGCVQATASDPILDAAAALCVGPGGWAVATPRPCLTVATPL